MPKLSLRSDQRLSTCHPDLQRLVRAAVEEIDLAVICGHRDQLDQDTAFKNGNSRLKWPLSKHNTSPSDAVDVVPYPVDWNNIQRFKDLAKVMYRKAEELGIKIEWGGDWVKFKDYPHWQRA